MKTPPPNKEAETLEEIAESVIRRGLPYSVFTDPQDYEYTKTWLVNEVLSCLRNERERCAKLAELMACGETYGTGRQKALNIAAAIREGKEF